MRPASVYLALALATGVCSFQAHATTYPLAPYVLTPAFTSTSPTATDTNSTGSDETFSDDFTFAIDTPYSSYFTAAFTESSPTYAITSADVTLYSGAPGSGTYLATTGAFDPITSPTPTLSVSDLGTGSYYIESSITVPGGSTGSYSITATASAAPEASTWLLMIGGLSLIGATFRYAQRVTQTRLRSMLTG